SRFREVAIACGRDSRLAAVAALGLIRRMRGSGLVALCSSVPWLLAACGSSTKSDWPKGNVVIMDANNYTSTSTLTIPSMPTASGVDLQICWDGLMKDLLCHNIVTSDIDNVSFVQVPNKTHTQIEQQLAIGKFDTNLVKIYGDYHVDQ